MKRSVWVLAEKERKRTMRERDRSTKTHPKTLQALLLGMCGWLTWAVIPPSASAQCMVVTTRNYMSVSPYTMANATAIAIVLTGNPGLCSSTMSANVSNCATALRFAGSGPCPAGPMNCRALFAIATGVTTMPGPRYCSANCGVCGVLRIDNADGLPVELLDFKVTAVPQTPRATEELSNAARRFPPFRTAKGRSLNLCGGWPSELRDF